MSRPDTLETIEAIDWQAAKERLASRAGAFGADADRSPEEARRIMTARRAELARLPPRPRHAERVDLVVFILSGERISVGAEFVRTVARLGSLTPVPFGPAALAGISNFHGRLLTVWDLTKLLSLATGHAGASSWMLVLGRGRDELAVLADEVLGIEAFERSEIGPLLDGPGVRASELFDGFVQRSSMLVLNGGAALSDERLGWAEGKGRP